MQRADELEDLYVYPERRLLTVYSRKQVQAEIEVGESGLEQGTSQQRLIAIVKRNTPGLVFDIGASNGKQLLWVAFSGGCRKVECAYGFVETEAKTYQLVSVPQRADFGQPDLFRALKWDSRKLSKGRQNALSEANEVYLSKTRSGDIRTMALQLKKSTDRKVQNSKVVEKGARRRKKAR